MRYRLYSLLEGPIDSRTQVWVRGLLQLLILLNVAAVVLDTVELVHSRFGGWLNAFEVFSVAVFSVEYLARLASCTVDPRYAASIKGRLRWMITPLAIIDMLAVLPAFLPFILSADLRSLRAVRLIRVFRILKLGRYSRAVQNLGRAISSTAAEIAVLLLALAIVLVLASTLVFYAERGAQPEAFSSIPAAAWWGIATVTTVGYGDVAPVTVLGRLAASIVAVLGIGLFAMPAGILGSAFVRQFGSDACPHCGEQLS